MSTLRMARLHGRSASRLSLCIGGALIAAVAIVAAYAMWQLREQALVAGRAAVDDQAFSLAAHGSQVLAGADFVLESVVQLVNSRAPADMAELRRQFATAEAHEQLRARQQSQQAIEVVTLVDASGTLIAYSRQHPAPPLDLSQRESVRAQRVADAPQPYIGAPVRNLSNGRWTFHLSRRLTAPDGRFIGVAQVGLSSEYLANFYTTVRLDRRAERPDVTATTLLRNDRAVMARGPLDEHVIGAALAASGPYAGLDFRAGRVRFEPPSQPGRLPWEVASNAGSRLLFAFQPLDGYPLGVAVAARDSVYLAAWRRQAAAITGFAAAAALFVAVAVGMLVRLLRRREQEMLETARLRDAADAANRAKSDFLATMSHEIRTPMNGILGTADLLARQPLATEQRRLAEVLLRSSRTLLSIINDILDLSKIEAGELQLVPAPFRAQAMVDGVTDLFGSYAQSKGLRLRVDVMPDVPEWLVGDMGRIRQVLVNLVGNAIKFSHTGTVRLLLQNDGPAVPLPGEPCRVRFEVQDRGVGIAAEARERVFKPFAQADATIGKRFGGTGLGLTISERLVRMMGGQLDFDSTLGQGTTFWFVLALPVADAPPATAAPLAPHAAGAIVSASSEPAATAFVDSDSVPLVSSVVAPLPHEPAPVGLTGQLHGHVLVVEDNPVNALVVEAQLATLGCSCQIAVDGEDALRCLREGRYDVVLMDCMLPGMTGYDATRAWREQEREQGLGRVPIVALTANVLASNVEACNACGMDDYLSKPCTVDKLAAKLGQWLHSTTAAG
jgi:signal transduction histidine kinase/ActR/RegA family two-component response regulator